MSGTVTDPAAMDAKLDRILGQLTTINNRLNSVPRYPLLVDARLARVEIGNHDSGKDSGKDDGPEDDATRHAFDSARGPHSATRRRGTAIDLRAALIRVASTATFTAAADATTTGAARARGCDDRSMRGYDTRGGGGYCNRTDQIIRD